MQRKSSKQSRGANSEEKAFQAWLKEQPCAVTGNYGVHVHHCAGSSYKHNKTLVGHWFCLPLSPDMHAEYHAGTKAFKQNYGTQAMLWVDLMAKYVEDGNQSCQYEVELAIMNCGK